MGKTRMRKNTTQKSKTMSNMDPSKIKQECTQMLAKG